MNFSLIKFITGRFSKSGRRRRFLNFARSVALISVMLGSMALIISLSVLEGFEKKLRESAVKFTSHITISSFKKSSLGSFTAITNSLKNKFPEIESIEPIVQTEGLIRSKSFVDGIILRGIMPDYDINKIKDNIIDGSFGFSNSKVNEIIIGERLAKKLKVSLSDEVIIYVFKTEGASNFPETQIEKFTIVGIYRSGMAQYDEVVTFIPFQTGSGLTDIPNNSATSFEVLLKNIDKSQEVSSHIQATLSFPYFSRTVFEIHKPIFEWIELQKGPIPLVLGLISIVAVLNIFTTLLISVVEKTHSIGILRSLGMKKREIMSIFIFQGVSIGFIGTVLGCGIGLLLCWLQKTFDIISLQGEIYFLDTLPIELSLWHYLLVIGCSIFLSFLSTLIPSIFALRISPVRAIRFK